MTTPLEQLRDELIGWFDVEFEPDAIDLVRRFYDCAASEHERAEQLAVQLEQMDNELLAEIAAKKNAYHDGYRSGWKAYESVWGRDALRERDEARRELNRSTNDFVFTTERLREQVDEARQIAAQLLRVARIAKPWMYDDLDWDAAYAALSPALRHLVEGR